MFAFALLDARDYRTAERPASSRSVSPSGCEIRWRRAALGSCTPGLMSFWLSPIRNSIPQLKRADAELLALGDHQFAPWNSQDLASLMFSQGSPLDEVLTEVDHGLALAKRFDHAPAGGFLALVRGGAARSRRKPSREGFARYSPPRARSTLACIRSSGCRRHTSSATSRPRGRQRAPRPTSCRSSVACSSGSSTTRSTTRSPRRRRSTRG